MSVVAATILLSRRHSRLISYLTSDPTQTIKPFKETFKALIGQSSSLRDMKRRINLNMYSNFCRRIRYIKQDRSGSSSAAYGKEKLAAFAFFRIFSSLDETTRLWSCCTKYQSLSRYTDVALVSNIHCDFQVLKRINPSCLKALARNGTHPAAGRIVIIGIGIFSSAQVLRCTKHILGEMSVMKSYICKLILNS